jgi:hypothetical protein
MGTREEMIVELGFCRFSNILQASESLLDCVTTFPTAVAPWVFYAIEKENGVQL